MPARAALHIARGDTARAPIAPPPNPPVTLPRFSLWTVCQVCQATGPALRSAAGPHPQPAPLRTCASIARTSASSRSAASAATERGARALSRTGTVRNGMVSAGQHTDFSGAYEGLNSYYQGSVAGSYTVRGGESLQQIAASLYGDSSLWYKIAEANGISGGASESKRQAKTTT